MKKNQMNNQIQNKKENMQKNNLYFIRKKKTSFGHYLLIIFMTDYFK